MTLFFGSTSRGALNWDRTASDGRRGMFTVVSFADGEIFCRRKGALQKTSHQSAVRSYTHGPVRNL